MDLLGYAPVALNEACCRPLERGWLRIHYDQPQILNFALSRDESNFQLPRHWSLLMYLLRSVLFVRAMTVE